MNHEEYLKRLGKKIVKRRGKQGLQQLQLAEKVGISAYSLRRIEKGQVSTGIIMLRRLSKHLRVRLSELVDIK